MNATKRTTRDVVVIVAALCFLFAKMNAIRPKKTTAIIVCPLGNAKVDSWMRALSGRGLWIISFSSLIIIPVVIIVDRKIRLSFFLFLAWR